MDPLGSTLIPILRCADARAALAFLEAGLGFRVRLVVPTPDGGVLHAQLEHGGRGMVMLASLREEEAGGAIRPPGRGGGAATHGLYLVVEDVDAAAARAEAAGAEVLVRPHDVEHGGRLATCRDPEGYVWNLGSYDPWVPPQRQASASGS